jgi:hypothetical protein
VLIRRSVKNLACNAAAADDALSLPKSSSTNHPTIQCYTVSGNTAKQTTNKQQTIPALSALKIRGRFSLVVPQLPLRPFPIFKQKHFDAIY